MKVKNISIFNRYRGKGISVLQCACLSFPYFTHLIAMHHSIIQGLKLFSVRVLYSSAEHNPSSFPYLHGWVEARVKQGFVFNDVADSRHDGLVKENVAKHPATLAPHCFL